MDSNEFWTHRLTSAKSRVITDIVEYCVVYEISHSDKDDKVYNIDKLKSEIDEMVGTALGMYIADN